jgi:hypothetical protein
LSDTEHKGDRTWWSAGWLRTVPLLICVALYFFNAYAIYKYSVNVPYWDDWAMFSGDNHPASIDLTWLNALHNEHRIATYKFMVWLQFQINGWNYTLNLLFNLVVFGLLLAYLVRVAHKTTPYLPLWVFFGFIIFLLSPINWFSHFSAMQLAFHLYLLFFFIACDCLFDDRQRFRELLIGCLAMVLCIYSTAGGVVTSLVMMGAFCLFKGGRIYRASGKDRPRELFQLLLVFGIAAIAFAAWMIGYVKPAHHPALVYPYTLQFWNYLANLISLGFGFMRVSSGPGALCLLIVIIPICGKIWNERHNLSRLPWTALALTLGLLANAATTAMGRAGFGLAQAKSDRYVELVLPLLLISVCNWALFLRRQKNVRTAVLMALWLICAASFARKWDFGVYRNASAGRVEGRLCVDAFYRGSGDGQCPTISPFSIKVPLEQAKRLNASIYREAKVEDFGPSK